MAARARVDAAVIASDGEGGVKAFEVVATKAAVAIKKEQVQTQVGDFILLFDRIFDVRKTVCA